MLLSKIVEKNHATQGWRAILMLLFAMLLLLIQSPNVSAAPPKAGNDGEGQLPAIAVDALCVTGLVINHQEQPLQGWTITASYVGTNGTAEAQTAVSGGNGRFRFNLPVPGRWLFSIAIPSDWQAVTNASFEVDISYGATDCANIRFKVQQQVTVRVLKIDDDHNPLSGWTIIATPGPTNTFSEVQTAVTGEDGYATFVLTPGHWIFTEQAPDGITWWRPIMPVDGEQDLNVQAPGPYTIRFKNDIKIVKEGCIEVIKRDVAPDTDKGGEGLSFGLPDWPIEVRRVNGSIAASGTTDAFGEITFTGLPYGPYVVREIMLPGWEAAAPTTYEVTIREGDNCQVIEFKNKQTKKGFCFEGQKLDANGNYGIAGWEVDAIPVETGSIDPDPVYTNGEGKFRIDLPLDDYRVPGATYQVCEEERAGWTSVNPTCQTFSLPEYPGACVQLPPFVNRQTNTQYPPPRTEPPAKHENKGHQGNPNDKQHGNPVTCSSYHTVKRGESLSSIAPRYGTNVQGLLRANPWVRSQRNLWLYVGQKVCIP